MAVIINKQCKNPLVASDITAVAMTAGGGIESGEGGSRHQLEAEDGWGDGGRGTRVSRWRIQVDQTDRKAGSRDGRQGRRAGEGQRRGSQVAGGEEQMNSSYTRTAKL